MTTVSNSLMSLEGEQAVLAALMLGGVEAIEITTLLTTDDFCHPTNKLIAEAAWHLILTGQPIDPITVADQLGNDTGNIPEGIESYLVELLEMVPVVANWRAYADIVKERSSLRRVLDICKQGTADALRNSHSAIDITHRLVKQLTEALSGPADNLQDIESVYQQTMESLQQRASEPEGRKGLSTGLRCLDDRFGGLAPGKLIAMAGRPAMGKSVLAQGISDHCAFNQSAVVMHYTLEMPADEYCERQLASVCGIDNKCLKTANLTSYEWEQLVDVGAQAKNAKLYISDVTNLRVEDVERQAIQVEQKEGRVDLIVVDYLQLMDWPRGMEEVAGLGYLSRSFKKLAGKMQCPIIIVCQLNRKCEERPDKRPLMSDLRGSGAIEQDCDIIMMCYRDEYYHENTRSPGVAEVITRKFRQGECGTDHLKFEGQHYRFTDLPSTFKPPSHEEDAQQYSYQQATKKGYRRG